jgi:MFS family permease
MAISLHDINYDPVQHQLPPRRYAWSVFAIVFALMVVDYVDRQVVVSMFPHLKGTLGSLDRQLGALVSIVSVTVALGTVPLSLLADRWSRVKSIFLMAIIWSSGDDRLRICGSFTHLIGARAVVGLGEAAYGSAGAALLASLFPARMRSTVLGAFLAAGLVGSVLGVVLGGVIAERWGGRRASARLEYQASFSQCCSFSLCATTRQSRCRARAVEAINREWPQARSFAALLKPRTALVTCLAPGFNL